MTFKHLKAVVFDWAGTVIDHGSQAPVEAFVEVFRAFGIEVSTEEARGPMGLPKLDHIQAMGAVPRIREAWREVHGHPFGDEDANRVFEAFAPASREAVIRRAAPIPGAVETVRNLRRQGLRIGSTTGYTRAMMEPVLPIAAAAGYAPDNLVCAGDLPRGRPTPLMMYRCFLDLEVWPASSVVKVDDTAPGIAEGLAAGCWTVGVALSGNGTGLSAEGLAALDPAERAGLRRRATAGLVRAGAHLVVDGVADLVPALDAIEGRLARGKKP